MKSKSLKKSLMIFSVLTATVVAVIMAVIGIQYLSSITNMAYKDYEDAMDEGYKTEIKSQVQSAITVLQRYYDSYQKGDMTLEEAQNQAKETVRNMRYRDDSSGYMWIDATDYTLVMHPILPQNEGTNRYKLEDQNGVMIIQEIMKSVQNGSGGYNEFYFTKADGVTVAQKLAYSEKFSPWNWVVTTGNYTDDMDAQKIGVKNTISSKFTNMCILLSASVVVLLIICIIVSNVIGNAMIKPILLIEKMAERMSKGNVSETIHLKEKNEIGRMSAALNQAQDNIKELVSDISNASTTIKNALNSFSGTFTQMGSSISEVSSAMDDISQNITVQADSTKTATDDVNKIGDGIDQTGKEIEMLDHNAQNMSELSNKSMETLQELITISDMTKQQITDMSEQTSLTNQSVQKIRDAANMINDIAEQTDLLALNASIEAARAGEAGKGFAVVAEQIGNLAKQSAENVVSIGNVVEELLSNSEKSLTIMDNMTNQINKQFECINNTKVDFESLHQSLDGCTQSVGAIDTMTSDIEIQRQNITDVLTQLNSIAQDNAASTEETTAMSAELASLVSSSDEVITALQEGVEKLVESVNQFTTE